MPRYRFSTGLVSTHVHEHPDRETAWNALTDELNREYAMPKAVAYGDDDPGDSGVTGTLYEKQDVPIVHDGAFDAFDGGPHDKLFVPVARGYVSLTWTGERHVPPGEVDTDG